MKPKFVIDRLGAQDKSPTYDIILSNNILEDIVEHITGNKDYDVVWQEKRNKGRLITLETDTDIYYINLSKTNFAESRNAAFQSVATAIGVYLEEKVKANKPCTFYFYFLPFHGNNKTPYMQFIYKVMKTAGIYFLNPEYGLKNIAIDSFVSVKELIKERNLLKSINSGNKSTYIIDEGNCYHIYGKTFGANQKETTLLCIALSALTDKPLKLFQIIDNKSEALSESDILAIKKYANDVGSKGFEIMDDSMAFENGENTLEPDEKSLRSPKFVYNLLDKFGGEKKCVLCECNIESIIQAAHIYPVAAIKRRTDIEFDKKFEMAIDADNGIWLCENHHKLFDKGLLWFEEGKVCISSELSEDGINFVEKITTIEIIEPQYINDKMLSFFDMRAKVYQGIAV